MKKGRKSKYGRKNRQGTGRRNEKAVFFKRERIFPPAINLPQMEEKAGQRAVRDAKMRITGRGMAPKTGLKIKVGRLQKST